MPDCSGKDVTACESKSWRCFHRLQSLSEPLHCLSDHESGAERECSLPPLDWSGPEPLGVHQLEGLKPLYKDFMYWPRCLRLCNVSAEVPSHYIYVGNRPSFCQESSDVYGLWDDGYEVYRQLQWQEIPEEQRQVYKAAIDSKETVPLAGTEVRINTRRLHDEYIPFGHAEDLRSLPCLSALNLERWHPGLLEYLRTNRLYADL